MSKKFLAYTLAAFLVVAAVLTGCSGSGSSSANSKILYFAQSADPRGLDPAWVDDSESTNVTAQIYEGLLKYKKDGTAVEPCLATSWTISPDGTQYTFKLRKNVKFQDGTPFNADAVVYNIERQLPPKASADMPYASFTFGPVKDAVKIDNYTVRIDLTAPYTPFLANLAMTLAAPMASPTALKAHNDNINNNPVGTGPFKFVKWDKGQDVELQAYDGYWGTKPSVGKIIYKIEAENSVRASDLIAGSVNTTDEVDPNDIPKMKQNNVKIYEASGMNINYMAFNCSRAPFDTEAAREAVAHAINKPELVKYLYQDYAEVANTILPSFVPGYDSSVQQYGYDPDKAKQMIQSSGLAGKTINIITYSNSRPYNPVDGQKLAEAVQNYLNKVGLKSQIQVYDWTTYKQKIIDGAGDICFYGWVGDNGDADNFMTLLQSDQMQSGMNAAKYKNTQVDSLLQEARTTVNGDKRNSLYGQIETIAAKDAPWVPISHEKSLGAYTSNVSGFYVHQTGSVFLNNVAIK